MPLSDNLNVVAGSNGLPVGTPIGTVVATWSGQEVHMSPVAIMLTTGAESSRTAVLVDSSNPLPVANQTGGLTDGDTANVVTQNGKTLAVGNQFLTPKFAKIDRNTTGDGVAVVQLVSGKKIRVLRLRLVCLLANGIKWQSGTTNAAGGTNTDLDPVESYGDRGGYSENYCPLGIMETLVGEALKLNLSVASQVSGQMTYVEAP